MPRQVLLGCFLLAVLPSLLAAQGRPGAPLRQAAAPQESSRQGQTEVAAQVAKILEANCASCHGAGVRVSNLDLRTKDTALQGGTHGPALVPGKPEESRLYRRVAGLEQPSMPPGKSLPADQVKLLAAWIAAGAPAFPSIVIADEAAQRALAKAEERPITPQERNWWSFKRPVRPALPQVSGMPANANPIDLFLHETYKKRGLQPAGPATRQALVRRAYLDLTGLPPTPAEVAAFVNDSRPDAWPRLVDQLLASPRYGERWGRHWLDIVRYSDSGGFEYDRDWPNAYRYRDYVVQSLNQDKPYDRFLQEQIAGDELFPNDPQAWVATSFLRLGPENNIKTEQTRMDELDDLIVTTSNGFLGLTVGCARCHNHKFDPIPQRDYYRMQAVYFPTKAWDRPLVTAEEEARHKQKVAAFEGLLKPLQEKLKELDKPFKDALIARKKQALPEYMRQALATPEAQRTEGQKLNVEQIEKTLSNIAADEYLPDMPADVKQQRRDLVAQIAETEKLRPAQLPAAMTVKEPGRTPPPSHFLHRGSTGSKGSVMQAGALSVTQEEELSFPPAPEGATSSFRRAGFAKWLTAPENPLTARVIVNRIWQNHFGEGIVRTPSNFGKMGERPTHPQLLDWLATELVANGWRLKQLHRLMMTSQAYQMASDDTEENRKIDPENRYFWRMPRRRLEGEAIRDSILSVAGTLDGAIGGPSVFPYIDPALYASSSKRTWNGRPQNDPSTNRRSIYVHSKRSIPLPLLEVFDKPDTITSCARRNRSTIAPQALILMNNEFVGAQARHFAQRLEREAGADVERQLELAYQLALARAPSASERERGKAFLLSGPHGLVDFCQALFNINEFVYLP